MYHTGLQSMGSWVKREQVRVADLNKCLFFLCSLGTSVSFNLPTDRSAVSNTCAPQVWVSTVQSSRQCHWGTVGSSCLVWGCLVWRVSVSPPWFPRSGWGQLRRISKSWKWPGTSSCERPPSFLTGWHFSVSAEEQWLVFSVGNLGFRWEIRPLGGPRPPSTALWAAPVRLEGVQCPPAWVWAVLPSRGAPASHMEMKWRHTKHFEQEVFLFLQPIKYQSIQFIPYLFLQASR